MHEIKKKPKIKRPITLMYFVKKMVLFRIVSEILINPVLAVCVSEEQPPPPTQRGGPVKSSHMAYGLTNEIFEKEPFDDENRL